MTDSNTSPEVVERYAVEYKGGLSWGIQQNPEGPYVGYEDYAALSDRIVELETERDSLRECVHLDMDLIQETRAEAYAEALEAAALMFIEERDHDWSGIQYAQDVGIPISNADDLQKSADRADKNARWIRALPNPYEVKE